MFVLPAAFSLPWVMVMMRSVLNGHQFTPYSIIANIAAFYILWYLYIHVGNYIGHLKTMHPIYSARMSPETIPISL